MHQLENLCNLPRLLLYPSHSSFVVDVGRSGKSLGWLGKRPNCYYLIHLHWKVDFLHFGTSSYPCCLRMQSYCSGVVEVLVMSKMKNCLKRLCFQWTLQFKYKVLTWVGTTRVAKKGDRSSCLVLNTVHSYLCFNSYNFGALRFKFFKSQME